MEKQAQGAWLQMSSKLTLILALVAIGGVASDPAWAQSVDHSWPLTGLVVEHAEIVSARSEGERARGYLTIWNGTGTGSQITGVRSASFVKASLKQTQLTDGVARIRRVDEIGLPGNSELMMRPDGVHVAFTGPTSRLNPGQSVDLVVTFEDGSELLAVATVLEADASPVDHHHGQGDGTGIN